VGRHRSVAQPRRDQALFVSVRPGDLRFFLFRIAVSTFTNSADISCVASPNASSKWSLIDLSFIARDVVTAASS
jgi:hypothetical protein